MEAYIVRLLGVLAQRGREVSIACGLPITHPIFEDMARLERGERGFWYDSMYEMLKDRTEEIFVASIVHRKSRTKAVRAVEDIGFVEGYTRHAYHLCVGAMGEAPIDM
jgi:hypothetical protein